MKRNGLWIRCTLAAGVVLAGLGLTVRRVAADAPMGRYTLTNDKMLTGTVYDNKTKLTWQQAVPSTTYNWSAAMSYCTGNVGALPGSGWRLPGRVSPRTGCRNCVGHPPPPAPPAGHALRSSPRQY